MDPWLKLHRAAFLLLGERIHSLTLNPKAYLNPYRIRHQTGGAATSSLSFVPAPPVSPQTSVVLAPPSFSHLSRLARRLSQMRLRAYTSPLYSILSHYTSGCAPAATPMPLFPFRRSLRSRHRFTASNICFVVLFFTKRKAEMLRAEEEGKDEEAWKVRSNQHTSGCHGSA